ncbi:spore photoproduct lyase [Desulfacinum hydrothermale DSM 13146]|uniref:Spore photoproduct lyase n=1 Tax=Desulfacinum hydrothermale DSM 13146 TaxID=1121390 RepID=A0A1W1XFX4_9BACT|nr:DNA photolyase [Desulfacinum hydrothermale]SMC22401.1 spore photoproduct lyase [Desulfacinum hydrothermale DSM 13146]
MTGNKLKAPIRTVLVEKAVRRSPLVQRLRKRLPHARFQEVETVPAASARVAGLLEVEHFKGRFWRNCPGTRVYDCCGYQIIHFGTQCTIDCTYCILQAYFNQPNLRLFGNTDDLLREVEERLDQDPDRLHRVGTGEFTDSLLLDPWTGLSQDLVPLFARRPNAVLELKTKTDHVDQLQDLPHGGHTLISWSLNAQEVTRREESRAASLRARLEAAQKCARWGYYLGFHFDPMIHYPGWRQGYRKTLDALMDAVDPSRVVWISLGAFRFMPELKPIIAHNHPRTRITTGEFIRGLDGKLRYFRDIRIQLYSMMVEALKGWDRNLCVYLCMEGPWIWRKVFGFEPADKGGLPKMLDDAVRTRMGVMP